MLLSRLILQHDRLIFLDDISELVHDYMYATNSDDALLVLCDDTYKVLLANRCPMASSDQKSGAACGHTCWGSCVLEAHVGRSQLVSRQLLGFMEISVLSGRRSNSHQMKRGSDTIVSPRFFM